MAKLLCIKEATLRTGVNELGDIVGVFADNHEFSQAEKSGFDIVKITSDDVKKTQEDLQKLIPANPDLKNHVKYKFKITNKSASTIATAVTCKITAKQVEI